MCAPSAPKAPPAPKPLPMPPQVGLPPTSQMMLFNASGKRDAIPTLLPADGTPPLNANGKPAKGIPLFNGAGQNDIQLAPLIGDQRIGTAPTPLRPGNVPWAPRSQNQTLLPLTPAVGFAQLRRDLTINGTK